MVMFVDVQPSSISTLCLFTSTMECLMWLVCCRHSQSCPTATLLSIVNATNDSKMGCGMSAEDKERKMKNNEIENNLKKEKIALANEIKMLLLGLIKLM
jgi:hypothetical protein